MTHQPLEDEKPARNWDFLKPTTKIEDALLDYGGDVAVAAALASFGVVALRSPAFNLSQIAASGLVVVCLAGAGIWVGIGISRLYTRLHKRRLTATIFTIAGGLLGIGAVITVIDFNEASRLAAICDRVENIQGSTLATSERCKKYYLNRDAAESKLIASTPPKSVEPSQ